MATFSGLAIGAGIVPEVSGGLAVPTGGGAIILGACGVTPAPRTVIPAPSSPPPHRHPRPPHRHPRPPHRHPREGALLSGINSQRQYSLYPLPFELVSSPS